MKQYAMDFFNPAGKSEWIGIDIDGTDEGIFAVIRPAELKGVDGAWAVSWGKLELPYDDDDHIAIQTDLERAKAMIGLEEEVLDELGLAACRAFEPARIVNAPWVEVQGWWFMYEYAHCCPYPHLYVLRPHNRGGIWFWYSLKLYEWNWMSDPVYAGSLEDAKRVANGEEEFELDYDED